MTNNLNRTNIFSRERRSNEPNWDAFRRSQEKETKAFQEIRENLRMQYNYADEEEIREKAGRDLGYGVLRIATHEYFIPLFQLYGKLTFK